MTALEGRYRRLLAVYPADHRQAYEREMLGVLMSGARPGQRFPGLAEAADLLRAGFVARLGTGRRALRDAAWRDAAVVASLVTALLMLAGTGGIVALSVRMWFAGQDPREVLVIPGQPVGVTLMRAAAWLAVVVAILAGRRRTAAALGVVALIVEVTRFAVWPPVHVDIAMHQAWSPVLIPLCVGTLLVAAGGRTAGQVLGRRGLVLTGAGIALGTATLSWVLPWWFHGADAGYYGLPDPVLAVALVLLLAGAMRAGRRALVLLAPALVVPLGHAVLWNAPQAPYAGNLAALIAILVVLPLVTLVVGVRFGGRSRGHVEGP